MTIVERLPSTYLAGDGRFIELFGGDFAASPVFDRYSLNAAAGVGTVADPAATGGRAARLLLRAAHAAGPDQGANLKSRRRYCYGTFEARIKAARRSSDDDGVVTGFFTYFNDGGDRSGSGMPDNSEIDFEWLAAEPESIYLALWTDYDPETGAGRRVCRKVNLARGVVEFTRAVDGANPGVYQDLAGVAGEDSPAAIPALPGYDSSAAYYQYGFRWAPDCVTWWIIHPATNQPIVLWEYRGPAARIPAVPAHAMANAWHSPVWTPEAKPQACLSPRDDVAAYVDWLAHQPLI